MRQFCAGVECLPHSLQTLREILSQHFLPSPVTLSFPRGNKTTFSLTECWGWGRNFYNSSNAVHGEDVSSSRKERGWSMRSPAQEPGGRQLPSLGHQTWPGSPWTWQRWLPLWVSLAGGGHGDAACQPSASHTPPAVLIFKESFLQIWVNVELFIGDRIFPALSDFFLMEQGENTNADRILHSSVLPLHVLAGLQVPNRSGRGFGDSPGLYQSPEASWEHLQSHSRFW